MTRPFHFYSPSSTQIEAEDLSIESGGFSVFTSFWWVILPPIVCSRLFWLSIRNFFCWVVWNIIFSLHWAKWIIRRRRPKSRKLLSSCVQFVYNILMTSSTKSRECNIISLVILTVFFTLRAEQQDEIGTQIYREFFVFDIVNYRFIIWPDDQALF